MRAMGKISKGRIVVPGHNEDWTRFSERLHQRMGDPKDNVCDTTNKVSREILEGMDGIDVEGTLPGFEKRGGYCDCEVILNVELGGSWQDEDPDDATIDKLLGVYEEENPERLREGMEVAFKKLFPEKVWRGLPPGRLFPT